MRYDELNWFDIEKYLAVDNRLMLVIGACEQHGYLSLLTDVKIPMAIADAASEQSGVIVAPPVNFGVSPYFLAYPGTISLRVQTMLDVVEDILRSIYDQGFRRIIILNGHGGNDGIRGRIYELANELDDMVIRWYAWWQSHSIEEVAIRYDLKPSHANWLEAFPFTRVSEIPDGKKTHPKVPGMVGAAEAREIYGDGVFGGAYSVDENIMDEIFRGAVQDMQNLLRFD